MRYMAETGRRRRGREREATTCRSEGRRSNPRAAASAGPLRQVSRRGPHSGRGCGGRGNQCPGCSVRYGHPCSFASQQPTVGPRDTTFRRDVAQPWHGNLHYRGLQAGVHRLAGASALAAARAPALPRVTTVRRETLEVPLEGLLSAARVAARTLNHHHWSGTAPRRNCKGDTQVVAA